MTLKLVSNIAELPLDRCGNVAASLRKLADEIEAGEYGDVTTLMALVDTPEALHTETFGDCPSRYAAAGMLDFAKMHIFDA